MRFESRHNDRFDSSDGAFSRVTNREYYDSQITLTDHESDIVRAHWGDESIHVGNVASNPEKASKQFRLYPSGETIELNLVFPKPGNTELRLYLSSRSGFKPDPNQVWFLYLKQGELWLGSVDYYEWINEQQPISVDESDSIYQISIDGHSDVRIQNIASRDTYVRDRQVALAKMASVDYVCEFDPSHKLFVSKATGYPYLEAHHLIPIASQGMFDKSLDILDNVFCLCPSCHRSIHHAQDEIASKIVERLSQKSEVLSVFNISLEQLYAMYNISGL